MKDREREGMKREKFSIKRRSFLNSDKSLMAAIKFDISYLFKQYKSKERYQDLNADLAISDCNRIVNLEFDVYDGGNVDARIKKAIKLRNTINTFVDEFIEKAELYKVREKEINDHNKEVQAKRKNKGKKSPVEEAIETFDKEKSLKEK